MHLSNYPLIGKRGHTLGTPNYTSIDTKKVKQDFSYVINYVHICNGQNAHCRSENKISQNESTPGSGVVVVVHTYARKRAPRNNIIGDQHVSRVKTGINALEDRNGLC